MKTNKRPTKLEEAEFKIHLDVDGDAPEVLDKALQQAKQLVQFIIGQDRIESHDVSLVIGLVIQERRGKDSPALESNASET